MVPFLVQAIDEDLLKEQRLSTGCTKSTFCAVFVISERVTRSGKSAHLDETALGSACERKKLEENWSILVALCEDDA